jgi:hypothetical protein
MRRACSIPNVANLKIKLNNKLNKPFISAYSCVIMSNSVYIIVNNESVTHLLNI